MSDDEFTWDSEPDDDDEDDSTESASAQADEDDGTFSDLLAQVTDEGEDEQQPSPDAEDDSNAFSDILADIEGDDDEADTDIDAETSREEPPSDDEEHGEQHESALEAAPDETTEESAEAEDTSEMGGFEFGTDVVGDDPASSAESTDVDELPEPSLQSAADVRAATEELAEEEAEPIDFSDLVDRVHRVRDRSSDATEDSSHADPRQQDLERLGAFEPDRNVLFLDGGPDICHSHLTGFPMTETNMLLVWLGQRLHRRVERLFDQMEAHPSELALVARRDSVRHPNAVTSAADDDPPITVERVSDPGDLPQLGISISQLIDDWHNRRVVVCLDSLTVLLQHAEPDRVFRFLHILHGRLSDVNASAHFHLDTRVHDIGTISTLDSLFDVTIEVSDGGISEY